MPELQIQHRAQQGGCKVEHYYGVGEGCGRDCTEAVQERTGSYLRGHPSCKGLVLLARTMALIEIPLGILTAAVGAPFFIWLLASG